MDEFSKAMSEERVLWDLVLRDVRDEIDEEIRQVLEDKLQQLYQNYTAELQDSSSQEFENLVAQLTQENTEISAQVTKLSQKVDKKFDEVKKLTEYNANIKQEQEEMLLDVEECLIKEKLRANLILEESEFYDKENHKNFPNEIDYMKAVKITLSNCYEKAKETIPQFKEKYESELLPALKENVFIFAKKLTKILEKENEEATTRYISKINSILDSNFQQRKRIQADIDSIPILGKIRDYNKDTQSNLFDIIRKISADQEVLSTLSPETQEQIQGVVTMSNSEISTKEKELIEAAFVKIERLLRIMENPEHSEIYSQMLNNSSSLMDKLKEIASLDFEDEMETDLRPIDPEELLKFVKRFLL
ncbi:unnamed protein product [Moneuplotes crassus]|uniref:Uncharacterized protein n=1 Tax=Euplotes crassus TaxID=5936 RepID=A0AAD1UFL2_EUPCR|nr:unnamed protein product [Moneuplotes crassus]